MNNGARVTQLESSYERGKILYRVKGCYRIYPAHGEFASVEPEIAIELLNNSQDTMYVEFNGFTLLTTSGVGFTIDKGPTVAAHGDRLIVCPSDSTYFVLHGVAHLAKGRQYVENVFATDTLRFSLGDGIFGDDHISFDDILFLPKSG